MVIEALGTAGLGVFVERVLDHVAPRLRRLHTLRGTVNRSQTATTHEEIRSETVDELRQAFGTAGLLNEKADLTLHWLAASRICDHLIKAAISGLTPDNSLKIVEAYHIQNGGSASEAQRFSAAVWAACKKIADLGKGVRSLAESFWQPNPIDPAQTLRAEAGFARVVESLSASHVGSPESIALAVVDIETGLGDFRRRLASAMVALNNEVDVHAPSGEVLRKPIDDVYVDIPIAILPPMKVDVKAALSRSDEMEYLPHTVGWLEVSKYIGKTVLLGDPGGGKSTQSKKIALEYAKSVDRDSRLVPIFLHMRTFSAQRVRHGIYSLNRFIVDSVCSILESYEFDVVNSYIDYLSSIGEILFIFDGLDEVLSTSARIEISKDIERFSSHYSLSPILVTSRVVGYEAAPMTSFRHLRVSKLNQTAMVQLVKNVNKSLLGVSSPVSDSYASGFVADAKSKAPDLVGNPLLLTLIIIIHSKRREIPDNRADLYSSCAELLFDRWDSYRDINPDLPERYRLYDLLMHIAGILYEKEELGGRLTRDYLKKEAKEFFKSDYIDNREGRAAVAAEKFAGHLTGRAWILHEVGEDVFEFTHRTFLEYFYARLLDLRHEQVEELVSHISPSVSEGQRFVPAHIALQMRTKDRRQIASIVADLLAGQCDEGSPDTISFVAETVNYLLPSAEKIQKLSAEIVSASSRLGSDRPIVTLASSNSLQSDIIIREVIRGFARIKGIKRIRELGRPLFLLADEFYHNSSKGIVAREEAELDFAYNLKSKKDTSVFATRVLFDLDLYVNEGLIKKYGLRLWLSAGRYLPYSDQRLIDGRRLLLSFTSKTHERNMERYVLLFRGIFKSVLLKEQRYDFRRVGVFSFDNSSEFIEDVNSIDVGAFNAAQATALLLLFMMRYEMAEGRKGEGWREGKSLGPLIRTCVTRVPNDEQNFFEDWLNGRQAILSTVRGVPRPLD